MLRAQNIPKVARCFVEQIPEIKIGSTGAVFFVQSTRQVNFIFVSIVFLNT